MQQGWIELQTIKKDIFELRPVTKEYGCGNAVHFLQLAFDFDNECMISIDSKGYVYWIDLSMKIPCFKKLGQVVEQATFITFNPLDKCEILIGLASADIIIKQLNKNFKKEYYTLIGHKIPPIHVSFYKNYCLTSSSKEVIIWNLKSYNKVHQLKIDTNNVRIKKAVFSPLGHLVVLYHNDTIQVWIINDLRIDIKLDLNTFDIHNIKDFNFTRNGRAILITGTQSKILSLDTNNWKLIKMYNLSENIGIKQINVIPLPLDGGSNKIVAILLTNCTLNFFDLSTACRINKIKCFNGIRKIAVSPSGKYLAYIKNEGNLKLLCPEKWFLPESSHLDKIKEAHRPKAHKINDHLRCIRLKIKKELSMKRLLPILKEFGEYPKQHRVLIWSTILKLPTNKNAYISLAHQQTRDDLRSDIFKNCHLLDRNKTSLLTTTVECLVRWCPLLIQSSFIPNLVFPFLVVLRKNHLLAFELVLSVLLNYCQSWFEYHPLPPLNILGIMENILLKVDPVLLNVFCKHGITSTEYAWPLLQSAMSEVLSSREWLILWDHLITHGRPSFLLLCVIAFSIYSRGTIISFLHSPEEFKKFYTTQGNIRAKDLMKIVEQMDLDIPSHLHPNNYIKDEIIVLPGEGPYPPFMLKEYPQFLMDDFHVLQYKRLKEQEQILQANYHEKRKISEDERLNRETTNFLKQIQDTRMKGAYECFQQQNDDLLRVKSLMQEESSKCACGKTKSKMGHDEFEEIGNNQLLDLEKLQEDVDLLEDEVQTFLGLKQ